jgi:octaprenyl-diphosphate synthase
VVDHSGLRRGKATANQKWGNAPSVLVGDFLYSRAFQLMVDLGSLEIMGVLSHATNTIAEGEVMQLANIGNCDLNEADYREVIRCKTALLFEAASHTGALLASQQISEINAGHVESMRRFGLHFGLAYQLLDDWLDYRGDSESMGKNVGDDLAEGKLTLPLIYALQNAEAADQATVRDAVECKNVAILGDILRVVDQCGALDYTRTCAQREIETALHYLNQIPDNDYQQALMQLSHYSLSRLG